MLGAVFRTIQVGLLVLCAYLLYGAVAPLVTSAALPEQRLPPVATADSDAVPLVEYGAIAKRGLFRTRGKPTPVKAAPKPKKVTESKIPWKLLATVASAEVPELSLATLMNARTRETRVVRIDDELAQVRVVQIERRRILLDRDGVLEELKLAEDVQPAKATNAQTGPRGAPARARRRPNNADNVRAANLRRARAKAAERAEALRANAQAEPAEDTAATPDVDALSSGASLRPSEQVVSINGIPVDDPSRMDELLDSMNSGETVLHVRDEDGNEREVQLEGTP